MVNRNDIVQQGVKKVGGIVKVLAGRLGVTPQALSQWEEVPPRRVLAFEKATGIPRHKIRPDIYPPPARKRGR